MVRAPRSTVRRCAPTARRQWLDRRRDISTPMIPTIALLLTAFLIQPAAPHARAWKSLFDGKSMNAWRIFKTDTAPKMCDAPGAKVWWEIANGVLRKDGQTSYIASKEKF